MVMQLADGETMPNMVPVPAPGSDSSSSGSLEELPKVTKVTSDAGGARTNGAGGPMGAQKRLRALSLAVQKLPRSASVSNVEELLAGQQLVQHNMTTLLLGVKRRHKWRVALLFAEWG